MLGRRLVDYMRRFLCTENDKMLILNVFLLFFGMVSVSYAGTLVKGVETGIEIPKVHKDKLVIRHTGFTLSYNTETNCPNWVAWELTAEEVNAGQAKRSNDFRADSKVPSKNRVDWYEYKQSGYDRGHMCPAGDMKWSADAMSDCFLMSNICPQTPELNQHWWEHVEKACRRWAKQEGRVYICCGPIFETGKKYIGKDVKIRVPDGYFKVVLSLRKGNEKAIGFIYTNTDDRQTMESAVVTVDEIEAKTGYDFFPLVDKSIQDKVEAECNLRKWR